MSVYYYLMNDTKRESVHLDNHVKSGPLTQNAAVHFAFCNYMMENLGDTMRLCGDTADEGEDYAKVDLLSYEFDDPGVILKIVELLNTIYNREKYAVVAGKGVERAQRPS
jgi:hypothetical protein